MTYSIQRESEKEGQVLRYYRADTCQMTGDGHCSGLWVLNDPDDSHRSNGKVVDGDFRACAEETIKDRLTRARGSADILINQSAFLLGQWSDPYVGAVITGNNVSGL